MLDHVAKKKIKSNRVMIKEAKELIATVRNEIAAGPDKYTRDDSLMLNTRDKIGSLLDRTFAGKKK